MSLNKHDFDKICRTCLAPTDNMISIFDPEITKMLEVCTTLKIEHNELPTRLCPACLQQISASYRFSRLCEQSHATLQHVLAEAIADDKTWFKEEAIDSERSGVGSPFTGSDNLSALIDTTIINKLNELEEGEPATSPSPPSADAARSAPGDAGRLQVVCDVCKAGFTNYKSLTEHKRTEHQNKSFECSKCGEKWNERLDLNGHVHTSHADCFPCKMCHKMFETQAAHEAHMPTHATLLNMCVHCNKTFEYAYLLRKHEIIHAKTKPYHCVECAKDFKYADSYRMHRRRKHSNETKRRCEICDKEVLHLRAHNLRKHTAEKPFQCPDCSANFATALLLRCHKKITHEKLYAAKKALCNVCGAKCLNNNALEIHMRKHSEHRPYACERCDKAFKSRNGYRAHEASHRDDRPYPCERCAKAFKQRKTLKRHMLVHTGERPHVCHICEKSFNQKSILRTHMKVHASDL